VSEPERAESNIQGYVDGTRKSWRVFWRLRWRELGAEPLAQLPRDLLVSQGAAAFAQSAILSPLIVVSRSEDRHSALFRGAPSRRWHPTFLHGGGVFRPGSATDSIEGIS